MPSLTQLFTLAALATVSFAASVPNTPGIHAHCSNAKIVHNTTIDVGDGKYVQYTSLSCAAQTHTRRGLFDSPPLCILLGTCRAPPPPAPTPPPPPTSVCGVSCTNACNDNAGNLPPISQDCDQIEDAIQIFQNSQPDAFVVDPNHLETLSFGTCSYFFSNTGTKQLQYCWSQLSIVGSGAGSACFPPVMPISSEGLCTASDYTWAVGAAHS